MNGIFFYALQTKVDLVIGHYSYGPGDQATVAVDSKQNQLLTNTGQIVQITLGCVI